MAIGASRVFHVNLNCSSLERSLEFLRDGLGLEAGARTAPADVQPGEPLGWQGSCRWDAWILVGDRGFAGTAIDLLEWKTPEPLVDPRPEAERTGFDRIVIRVADLERCRARIDDVATALGAGTPPTRPLVEPGAKAAFLASDPDDTAIAVIEGAPTGLAGVRILCRDLARSACFYGETLSFAEVDAAAFGEAAGEGNGAVTYAARAPAPALRRMVDRTGDFHIDLVQGVASEPARPGERRGEHPAVKGATTPRPMQALGIHRMALFTDDLARDHALLAAAGVPCLSPPVEMSMGPGLPALRFFCFLDPDGAVLELIEEPRGVS